MEARGRSRRNHKSINFKPLREPIYTEDTIIQENNCQSERSCSDEKMSEYTEFEEETKIQPIYHKKHRSESKKNYFEAKKNSKSSLSYLPSLKMQATERTMKSRYKWLNQNLDHNSLIYPEVVSQNRK